MPDLARTGKQQLKRISEVLQMKSFKDNSEMLFRVSRNQKYSIGLCRRGSSDLITTIRTKHDLGIIFNKKLISILSLTRKK
eukprot:c37974_g1_i1 orf=2-241(-)